MPAGACKSSVADESDGIPSGMVSVAWMPAACGIVRITIAGRKVATAALQSYSHSCL